MIFAPKLKYKPGPVYYGHPSTFWKERQRHLRAAPIDVNAMKKLTDVVDYDALHLTKSIINRTCTKLKDILQDEDNQLNLRKKELKQLLEREEEEYIQELVTKQEMEDCKVCVEKENKQRMYEEEIEREKVRECQKALEREKIAKGMQCTKIDEIKLREMQKLQMLEKRQIELEEEQRERMWHRVLIEDVTRKDEIERMKREQLQQEMLQRRMIYDEQIASATRRRKQALEQERQKENRRIETIKLKQQQDHLEAIKRKREQQMLNKKNYIEGYRSKLCKLESLKNEENRLDHQTIEIAKEELLRQKNYEKNMMKKLQKEKEIFLENHQQERQRASEMDTRAEIFIDDSRRSKNDKSDEFQTVQKIEKKKEKEKMAEIYKNYLEEKRTMTEVEKRERERKMERVREAAVRQLQSQLDCANQELQKQMEYRNSLNYQIENNQKVMQSEQAALANKQKYFWDKMELFQDTMMRKVDKSPGRISTNPIHPFAKMILKNNKDKDATYLPSLQNNNYK